MQGSSQTVFYLGCRSYETVSQTVRTLSKFVSIELMDGAITSLIIGILLSLSCTNNISVCTGQNAVSWVLS